MSLKKLLLLFLLLTAILLSGSRAEEGIYTSEYYLSLYPNYPPAVGEKITLRLRTFRPAQKVSLYSDREEEIPMQYREGYWWGTFQIPDDYQPGGHFFTVWLNAPFNTPPQPNNFQTWLINAGLKKKPLGQYWSKSVIWYPMVAARPATPEARAAVVELPPEISLEAEKEEPLPPTVTGEAMVVKSTSPEALPFLIKGTKTLSFSSKNIEGTKEGFISGTQREESLRLNIAGAASGTEVDANLISTSTIGSALVAQRQDKISVLVKRASTEAYLGDFTADLNETEFAGLNKVLSGVRVKGDYERWGFNALYSSPQGEAKFKRMYGDGTQGPYRLDAAPVVINSERVVLDGVEQKRGDDYTVDYQSGTITFVKKTIDPKSILNINYDFSQTIFSHSTYGLRLTGRPVSNLKLGATYLNDSDSLAGAAEIVSNSSQEVSPQSHYVVGADGSYVSELITANGEVTYSNKNQNLLATGSEESGKAAKFDFSSQLGPFGLKGYAKRVGASFLPISDPSPKQALTDYGGGLSWRAGSLFGTQANYGYDKYTQGGVIYENGTKSAKAGLTPERWPSLEYNYSEDTSSNDPVTGTPITRSITRNAAESNYRLGFFNAALKGSKEKWLNRTPSEEVTDYDKVNFGLATVGLEKIAFTSNVELENRQEPTGDKPFRKTYNVNLSANPTKAYFAAVSLDYTDDSVQGINNSTDLSFKAEPSSIFKTEGKYTITSVKEDFVTSEAVAKHSGSLSFDFRPFNYLRLRYLFKPNFTKIARTDSLSFNNEQQQTEINLIPYSELMLGLLNKVGHGFNINRQAAPNYTLKDNTSDTVSTLYTVKMAPLRIFSTEFNYLLENGTTTRRVTGESYLPGQSFNKNFDAIVKTSLSERFSIDSRYTYAYSTQGTGEAAANVADSVSHTGSLKGTWNLSDAWSWSVSGAYTKTTNSLSAIPVTYTAMPGLGFIYRQGDKLRIDFDWTYAKSYNGAVTTKTNYSLRGKYSVSDYVNVTLRAEQEISHSPDYRLTDISGNIEINL